MRAARPSKSRALIRLLKAATTDRGSGSVTVSTVPTPASAHLDAAGKDAGTRTDNSGSVAVKKHSRFVEIDGAPVAIEVVGTKQPVVDDVLELDSWCLLRGVRRRGEMDGLTDGGPMTCPEMAGLVGPG